MPGWRDLACAGAILLLPVSATGQWLPTEPITLADGRVVVAGEVSGALAPQDPLFFNYTDYEQSALRLLRLSLSSSTQLGDQVAVLSEVRSETGNRFELHAVFVRARPWKERPIDLQIGRIPPTFGRFGRRTYGVDNPLIGYPLAYQYLTSLRPDAIPASADDLLRMRGRGWRPFYPIGSTAPAPGLPLASALRWDTGVQVRVGDRPLQVVAAVTNGSLSNPRVGDDNDGKQIAARGVYQPSAGLIAGVSAARAAYLDQTLTDQLPTGVDGRYVQWALGADVEYSLDHWIVRAEGLVSRWTVPQIAPPFLEDPLVALGWSVEGQYKVRPGFYLAGRVDHVGFSTIVGTLFDGRAVPWDLPVTRVEAGGGFYVQRNLVTKVSYQHNWRDDPFSARRGFVTAQALYWF